MAQSKYITGEAKTEYGTIATAVCFSEVLGHADVARLFEEVWGAGFFYINDAGKVVAYGKSVGLNVVSRESKDARMIEKALCLTYD